MDDKRRVERPTLVGLGLDIGELLLGHAGIVFQRHGLDAIAAAAHQTGESHHAADAVPALGQRRYLGADITWDGATIELRAQGWDSREALEALAALVEAGFDESG